MSEFETNQKDRAKSLLPLVLAGIFGIYYVSNGQPQAFYDYTLRIAEAFLEGRLGLIEEPPSHLNEMIPLDGKWYSVFPLGSVLTMLPVALLKKFGLLQNFPGFAIAGWLAALTAYWVYRLSERYEFTAARRYLLALLPVLGTWMWANLAFAGAWQIALGVAVAAQLGALYFLLVKKNYFLAGTCFAFAFGNRTEILLLAPLFFYLIWRELPAKPHNLRSVISNPQFLAFAAVPFLLGLATLGYNYARFGSLADFGYARIPHVLEEEEYRNGIFSLTAIPRNFKEMLLTTGFWLNHPPYFLPTGGGGSIFLYCPFLIFLFRPAARNKHLSWLSVIAIVILTLILWCHGNPGGWQLSYRYAMVLLPWMMVILIENSPPRVSLIEWLCFIVSVTINGWGTYLFLRSEYMRY
ncbi:MAG: hypothetical protein HOP19_02985 [Acidobacteria bacterium]|nr:hypothetical protein [Acidobacteriota bacterium]